jgi:diguanylate cyclase (GGDEF)-like protein
MRRLGALTLGPGFAVMLAAILLSVVGGTVYTWRSFAVVATDDGTVQTHNLREAMLALQDLTRFEEVVTDAARKPAADPSDRLRIRIATDLLAERRARFLAQVPEKGSTLNQLVGVMNLTIGEGMALSADLPADGGAKGLATAELRLRALMRSARRMLAAHVDEQHRLQMAVLDRNSRLMVAMTVRAAGALAVVGALAVAMLVLLRQEQIGRRQREEAEQRARYLAYFDQMTGLPNRTNFSDRARQLIAGEQAPTLMLFDLDDFKRINDACGHAAGDAVLREAAQRLRGLVEQAGGMAARLGGDEFAALLPPEMPAADLQTLAATLIEAMRQPVAVDGRRLSATVSIGIVMAGEVLRDVPLSFEALMRAADHALYKSKTEGRNRYHFYDRDLASRAFSQQEMRMDMPAALAAGEFHILYQPQVNFAAGTLHGFEALIRWKRNGVLLPPSEFLAVAEESRFITLLDVWVLRNACREVAGWQGSHAREVKLSVNLSSLHFSDGAIVDEVRQALGDSGLPPHRLTLEITESVLIDDWEKVTAILRALHDLGVQIALDDFGTGFSSLSYLRKLAVDEVKVDRSFVTEVETSAQTRFMLDAVADIVSGLGMRMVIEGIETPGQCRILSQFGGEIGQGYLFGRPMEAHAARALVESGVVPLGGAGTVMAAAS